MTKPGDEAFLSRWSRLKRTEAAPAETPPPEPVPQPEPETDAQLLARLGLPDPETLVEGDDVSRFMRETVPAHLRRLALRRLWRLNPALGHVDGLLDYAEDFTDSATVVENMQTVYEVGKGAARRFLEAQEAAREAAAREEAEAPHSEEQPPGEVPDRQPEPPAEPLPEPGPVALVEVSPPEPAAPLRPRMVFTFESPENA